MNRKEADLIATALNAAKPNSQESVDAYGIWFTTVVSVKDALLDAGHIATEERFLGIADSGVNWRKGE